MSKKFTVIILFVVISILAVWWIVIAMKSVSAPSASVATVGLYQKQANKICKMLDDATTLYQGGKIDKAKKIASNAYWQVYDDILEIKYRSQVSPSRIFAIENTFHAIPKMMTKPVTNTKVSQIAAHAKQLCQEVNKEAHQLTVVETK